KIQTSRVRIFQKIDIKEDGYYQNGVKLSYIKLYKLFKNTQMDTMKRLGYLAVNSDVTAKSIRITAIPILSIGVGIILVSVLAENVGRHTFSFDTKLATAVGFSTMGGGGGLLLTGILLEKRAKKKLISAIDFYNQKIP
ncbi:MAG: hypothetical protein K2Q22_06890, partial [Cytophagales bacterium]|nr:hypothetical protein [Cytophagales bacterium]